MDLSPPLHCRPAPTPQTKWVAFTLIHCVLLKFLPQLFSVSLYEHFSAKLTLLLRVNVFAGVGVVEELPAAV